MAIACKKGYQAEKKGCEDRVPALPDETALPVKSNIHRSQPKPSGQHSTSEPPGHPWNHGLAPL
jgi:hypothetical protein